MAATCERGQRSDAMNPRCRQERARQRQRPATSQNSRHPRRSQEAVQLCTVQARLCSWDRSLVGCAIPIWLARPRPEVGPKGQARRAAALKPMRTCRSRLQVRSLLRRIAELANARVRRRLRGDLREFPRMWCMRPNVELTGTTRQTGLAAWRMMNLGARRPGRFAVECPVERHVRRRLLAQTSSIGEVA
jgi:hypothetical protein